MHPVVCRCCGEQIQARAANPNICMDCERLMEDESPQEAARKAQQQAKRHEVAASRVLPADAEVIPEAN